MEETGLYSILSDYGLFTGTYIICVISGIVPIVNAEFFFIFVSSLSTESSLPPVLIIGTLGQMTAKSVLYLSGKGILDLSHKRYEDAISRTKAKMEKWKSRVDLFMFISAFTGIPPFYAVSVIAGIVRHSFFRFFICGFVGRTLRFGLIMFFPQFFKQLFA
jgi:membrane protein YqaA with SNARE-associated domain